MVYKKRNTVVALAISLGLLTPGIISPAWAAPYERPVVEGRISGADRYETAVAVSVQRFSGATSTVFLTSGADFPDALSAAPAAATQKAALLLTRGDAIPAGVVSEIERLQPFEIVIIGGTNSVSSAVETKAKTLAGTVTRIEGTDRYQTSRMIAQRFFEGKTDSAYLAAGANFSDALTAGAIAGAKGQPVVLVDGSRSGMDAATTTLLKGMAPAQITIVGGSSAVSEGIEADSSKLAADVERFGGKNRYATAMELLKTRGISENALITSGEHFPDAIVGSALAVTLDVPLIIMDPFCLGGETVQVMAGLEVKKLTILGDFIPERVVEENFCI